jgi:hypothetical protein
MPKMSMHLNPSPSPGWFCGPECQRSAWPTHKLSCGKDSKASKDLESAKLEPTSSEKTLDSKLRCVFHVFFIPKDWLHLGILWYGCDIEYKLPWCNDSETWLSWLLLGPQNLNDHNFRENQQSPINLGVNSVALRWFRFLNPIGLLQPILGLIKQTHISTRGRKKNTVYMISEFSMASFRCSPLTDSNPFHHCTGWIPGTFGAPSRTICCGAPRWLMLTSGRSASCLHPRLGGAVDAFRWKNHGFLLGFL